MNTIRQASSLTVTLLLVLLGSGCHERNDTDVRNDRIALLCENRALAEAVVTDAAAVIEHVIRRAEGATGWSVPIGELCDSLLSKHREGLWRLAVSRPRSSDWHTTVFAGLGEMSIMTFDLAQSLRGNVWVCDAPAARFERGPESGTRVLTMDCPSRHREVRPTEASIALHRSSRVFSRLNSLFRESCLRGSVDESVLRSVGVEGGVAGLVKLRSEIDETILNPGLLMASGVACSRDADRAASLRSTSDRLSPSDVAGPEGFDRGPRPGSRTAY
jgi:hypothetical protein